MVRQGYSFGGDFGGTFLDSDFDWEVIVVDDASPDGTQEIARQLARVYGDDKIVRWFVYHYPRKPNYFIGVEASGRQARTGVRVSELLQLFIIPTYRCRTAYIHGLEFCTGDFVIIMDADFSHHVRVFRVAVDTTLNFLWATQPKFIPQFVRYVSLAHIKAHVELNAFRLQQAHNLDIVTGTRYSHAPNPRIGVTAPGGVHGWDLKRKMVSRGANFLADTVLNPGVSDLTGSFRSVAIYIVDVAIEISVLAGCTRSTYYKG